MSAIKFELLVKDSHKENGPRFENQIVVIALSFDDAKNSYYEKCGRYECEVVEIKNAEVARFSDLMHKLYINGVDVSREERSWIISDSVADVPMIEEIEPFPLNENGYCNPFWHDVSSMGTDLPKRWMLMHDGYDSKESPFPMKDMYFVRTDTGRRVRVHLRDKVVHPDGEIIGDATVPMKRIED